MSADSGLAATRALPWRVTALERTRDHRFFTLMGLAAALVAFVGFAPTYYLRAVYGGGPELTRLVHVHGVVTTGWILLYLAQTSLVGVRRVDLHRRLGIAGAILGASVLGVGYLTAVAGARRGLSPRPGVSPEGFFLVPLVSLLSFGALAGTGLWFRKRPETHKRLMLLATLAILVPALARLRFIGGGGPPVVIGGSTLLVSICLAYDRLAHGRVHPAFLWGGVLLVLSVPLRFTLAGTETWASVAGWLLR